MPLQRADRDGLSGYKSIGHPTGSERNYSSPTAYMHNPPVRCRALCIHRLALQGTEHPPALRQAIADSRYTYLYIVNLLGALSEAKEGPRGEWTALTRVWHRVCVTAADDEPAGGGQTRIRCSRLLAVLIACRRTYRTRCALIHQGLFCPAAPRA
jgi:hypothetical protein